MNVVLRVALVSVAFVWLMACASSGVDAERCLVTNEEAPSVVTLMASPQAPTTAAIVLYPNCSYKEFEVDEKGQLVNGVRSVYTFFHRVESLPSTATSLQLQFDRLEEDVSSLDLSWAASVTNLQITSARASALEGIKLPPSLTVFYATYGDFPPSFKNATIPTTVTELTITWSNISALPPLPPNLTSLTTTKSQLTTVDYEYPSTLTYINLVDSYVVDMGPATLPAGLEVFAAESGMTQFVRGIAWPHTIKTVWLWANAEIEIRQSDVDLFDMLKEDPFRLGRSVSPPEVIPREKCSDETAEIVLVRYVYVCVITDARFESRYGLPPGWPWPSKQSPEGNTPESPSGDEPSGSPSTPGTGGGGGNDGGSSSGRASNPPPNESGNTKSESTTRPPKSGGSGTDTNQSTESSRVNGAVIAVAVLLSVAVAVALAVIGYRVIVASKRRDPKAYGAMESPSHNPTEEGSAVSKRTQDEFLESDIRNDPRMVRLYIELAEVTVSAVVARSRLYETLYGEYNSRPVVLKRLSKEGGAVEDGAVVDRFMDEIRLCSTLNHRKIVEFIGVTGTNQPSVAIISEYMDSGDLSTLLYKQPVPTSPQDWFQPWTATKTIKSKVMIARDIIEAVVYLHSFQSPILHRDLKARNVLLDSQGNAKLNGFGISREMSEDETMTSAVGTVAWIAPEVLRGDRYSEKADIYSLGVLLVELDRCRHPYEAECGSRQLTNSQIAAAVVSGELRPSVTDSCPNSIKELVDKCLSFDAEDRPTAMAVHFALRRMNGD